jgi:hypothetical protein
VWDRKFLHLCYGIPAPVSHRKRFFCKNSFCGEIAKYGLEKSSAYRTQIYRFWFFATEPHDRRPLTAGPEMNRRTVIRRDLLRAEVARKRRDLRGRWQREGERPKGTDKNMGHLLRWGAGLSGQSADWLGR